MVYFYTGAKLVERRMSVCRGCKSMLSVKGTTLIFSSAHRSFRPAHSRTSFTWPACLSRTCRDGSVRSPKHVSNFHKGRLSVVAAATACKSEERSIFGALEVQRIPCLSDNYAWLIRDQGSAKTAIVDPSESGPVLNALEQRSLKLDYILNTHHHWDHVGGNEELKRRTGAFVVAPKADADRIPCIDLGLAEGDRWQFGDLEMICMETPGHTRHGLAFYFPSNNVAFTGDTLFSLGCGRLFEGTPEQMFTSLQKLQSLPADTWIMPGHEYTQSNAKFAMGLEPSNPALQQRNDEINALRSKNQATVPSLLGVELDTNPFLRSDQPEIRQSLGLQDSATPLEVFTAVRKAKDNA